MAEKLLPYSEDNLDVISSMHPNLTRVEVEQRLTVPALDYILRWELERKRSQEDGIGSTFRPTKKERRKALGQVREAAVKLKEALEDHAILYHRDEDQLLDFDTGKLDELASAATDIADSINTKGANPEFARDYFVGELANLFREGTGSNPTRRFDFFKRKEYGPFRDFVIAALEPLNAEAVKGIDNIIQRVLSGMSSNGQ